MAFPTNRTTFIDYMKRKLGHPVVEINVDNEQVEDAVDDALLMYRDYHFDGIERVFLKHTLTAEDITNKYLTLDNTITGVVSIFDVGLSQNINNLFNLRYQLRMNDLFDFSNQSYVSYVMAMRHVETLQENFVGKKPIRWNRMTHQLHIDLDWKQDVLAGDIIIIDCYKIVNPNTYTDIWNDPWLKKYATSLLKKQWGSNIKKFGNVPMLGGLTFNGKEIYDEAEKEIKDAEDELKAAWTLPTFDMVGSFLLCVLTYYAGL